MNEWMNMWWANIIKAILTQFYPTSPSFRPSAKPTKQESYTLIVTQLANTAPNVHYRIHQRSPVSPSWARCIHSPSHIYLRVARSAPLPSGLQALIPYTLLVHPMRATCLFHLISLQFIALTIFCTEHELRRFSSCHFLNSPPPSEGSLYIMSGSGKGKAVPALN
jgi:hypothetical protein